MAKKSETSQQRRARQNRARREALAARTSGQAVKRPSRVAPATAEKLATSPRTSARAGSQDPAEAPAKGAGRAAKPRRERPPKPGDRPVDVDALEGSWVSKVVKVPGGMQVLMAVALTLVVTGLMAFMDTYVADVDKNKKDAKPSLTIFEVMGTPKALLFLGIPVLAVGVAAAYSLHRQRRRIWIASAVVLSVFFILGLFQYLFPMGFLLYGVMRSSRIEGPNAPMFGRRSAPAADDEAEAADEA